MTVEIANMETIVEECLNGIETELEEVVKTASVADNNDMLRQMMEKIMMLEQQVKAAKEVKEVEVPKTNVEEYKELKSLYKIAEAKHEELLEQVRRSKADLDELKTKMERKREEVEKKKRELEELLGEKRAPVQTKFIDNRRPPAEKVQVAVAKPLDSAEYPSLADTKDKKTPKTAAEAVRNGGKPAANGDNGFVKVMNSGPQVYRPEDFNKNKRHLDKLEYAIKSFGKENIKLNLYKFPDDPKKKIDDSYIIHEFNFELVKGETVYTEPDPKNPRNKLVHAVWQAITDESRYETMVNFEHKNVPGIHRYFITADNIDKECVNLYGKKSGLTWTSLALFIIPIRVGLVEYLIANGKKV